MSIPDRLKTYQDALAELGYEVVDEEGQYLVVKHEWSPILLHLDDEETSYVQLLCANFWALERNELTQGLLAAATATANTMVAKVYMEGTTACAAVEMFCPSVATFKAIVRPAFEALDSAIELFKEALVEIADVSAKSKAMKPPADSRHFETLIIKVESGAEIGAEELLDVLQTFNAKLNATECKDGDYQTTITRISTAEHDPDAAVAAAVEAFTKTATRTVLAEQSGGTPAVSVIRLDRHCDAYLSALESRNVPGMQSLLQSECDPAKRHYLLMGIVDESYRMRLADPRMREVCKQFAEAHLQEFPALVPGLIGETGSFPIVTSFAKYSTALMEDGEYGEAIRICERALSYGVDDGTKEGYLGRIRRIKKAMLKRGSTASTGKDV